MVVGLLVLVQVVYQVSGVRHASNKLLGEYVLVQVQVQVQVEGDDSIH